MDIMNEEEVDFHEARNIIVNREKEGELVYEQKICSEYLEKVSNTFKKKTKELVEELKKIIILKPRHIVLIINIMPDTEDEVNALFSKEVLNLKKEEVQQVVDIVKKYKK
ncbi:hypothetical protein ACFLQN_04670 [Candidatus Aenigmatarchaeota archaeon]